MRPHISNNDIRDYLGLKLRPGELLIADEHFAECAECYLVLADLRASAGMGDPAFVLESDPANDGHLNYDQFAAYIDGNLDEVDREIVDVHRGVCRDCSDQLDGLFRLKETLQAESETAPVRSVSVAPSDRPVRWWSIPSFRVAVPAFAVLLLGIIVWAVLFRDPTRRNDVAAVQSPAVDQRGVTEQSPVTVPPDATNIVNANSAAKANSAIPVISLADGGGRIEIDAAGNIAGLDAPQFETRVKAAMTNQMVEIPAAAKELRSRAGVLMGGDQAGVSFALTAPVGRIVHSTRPPFRWKALTGANSYVVRVYDSNFTKVDESPPLQQTSWTPSVRLKAGAIYQWQVTASKNGEDVVSPVRPAPDARFKIVDAAAANDIATAKRSYRNSHLILGIAYANAGLIDEAEREFQALLKQNPNSSVIKSLLQKIRSAR